MSTMTATTKDLTIADPDAAGRCWQRWEGKVLAICKLHAKYYGGSVDDHMSEAALHFCKLAAKHGTDHIDRHPWWMTLSVRGRLRDVERSAARAAKWPAKRPGQLPPQVAAPAKPSWLGDFLGGLGAEARQLALAAVETPQEVEALAWDCGGRLRLWMLRDWFCDQLGWDRQTFAAAAAEVRGALHG